MKDGKLSDFSSALAARVSLTMNVSGKTSLEREAGRV